MTHRSATSVTRPVPNSVGGRERWFTDPLWGVTVSLSELELALLRSAPVRRLHGVAHAGATSITTLQTYSRLEHSLGVLALVAHLRPEDGLLRAAALLHDVGHLPFSHTLEGLAGLDHHELTAELIGDAALVDLLKSHGVDPSEVLTLLSGTGSGSGGWEPPRGLLGIDHLDSLVRSARAGARLHADPASLLARVRLLDGAVDTDRGTADTLTRLISGEVGLHTSWESVAPAAVLRELVRDLLARDRLTPARLARLTDAQLWAVLEADPGTREGATALRLAPHLLRTAVAEAVPPTAPTLEFSLRKIYVSAPLVNGNRLEMTAPDLARRLAELRALPTHFHVWRDEHA
ncbi:HD superfamily phosphohydrolase [Streptacidiphilus sp. MAP12-33]|uniref:HD domain-containing protein n=1 Tax=Streptacidiphilus sp. MAP12-33 TaxID=3156266 RepID=UPI003514D7B0